MTSPSGVLLIDKPTGMTSHDVVGVLRRKLGTRRVGHAGTLDPMATGLLVILVEQGTKLEPHLSCADKSYDATVSLGRATRTLDAQGETTTQAPASPDVLAEIGRLALDLAADAPLLARALRTERERRQQVPPAFSAIHVDGVRSYARARAGEDVELPPRPVEVKSLELQGASLEPHARLELSMRVAKGYYVRSFARDLGDALGCPAHLSALRRVRSGGFELAEAALIDAPRELLLGRLISLVDAVRRHLPLARLDAEDELRARCGKTLSATIGGALAEGERVALTSAGGEQLVAIAERQGENLVVVRGFAPAEPALRPV